MTTTTNVAFPVSDILDAQPAIPTRGSTVLRDAIYLELDAQASLETDFARVIQLNLASPANSDPEYVMEDNDREVVLFIAVDHVRPARFFPAVVKAEPGCDFMDALGGSAVVRADGQGFRFTFHMDAPCEHVIDPFVCAEPQFGILERAGLLFVGVRLGDLQAFAALKMNTARTGTPYSHLSMESSAAGNGFMLELVDSRNGERMYSRFVLLPKKFMSALRRAIARQIAAPTQLPLELQLATHYSAFFNPDQNMVECWSAARQISVGKDCPVQRFWIRVWQNFEVSK